VETYRGVPYYGNQAMPTWYTSDPVFDALLAIALLFAAATVFTAPFMHAPYGRFASAKRSVNLDPRLGWFLMELPSTLAFWPVFVCGQNATQTVPLVLATIWGIHYLNRGFIFPALMRVPRGARTFGLLTVVTGMIVTSLHGYLNARFFSALSPHYGAEWLHDPRFGMGLTIYAVGLVVNIHADAIIRNLRTAEEIERGEKVYRIPRGGAFQWVTNGSYLGELMAWTGFALLTWSLPGLFILAISAANLVPRAIETHRWYQQRFPDYPKERRILIPYVF